MNAVGCHIFAGGFTLGVVQHFDVVAHFEGEAGYGSDVVEMNRDWLGDFPIYRTPPWEAEARALRGTVPFVYANPPCAPFSQNNSRSAQPGASLSDTRVECIDQAFNLLGWMEPEVFCFESVTGIVTKGQPILERLTNEALDLGYSVTHFLHNTMWHGSYQSRRRYFFIAHKHRLIMAPFYSGTPPKTLAMALAEVEGERTVPVIRETFEMMKYVDKCAQGKSLGDVWAEMNPDPEKWERNVRGQVKGRPAFSGWRRPHLHKPGYACVGYNFIHPTEDRMMSYEEYQVAGDFPQDYRIPKNGSLWSLVARGVSPEMGRWMAETAHLTIATREPWPQQVVEVDATKGADQMTEEVLFE